MDSDLVNAVRVCLVCSKQGPGQLPEGGGGHSPEFPAGEGLAN